LANLKRIRHGPLIKGITPLEGVLSLSVTVQIVTLWSNAFALPKAFPRRQYWNGKKINLPRFKLQGLHTTITCPFQPLLQHRDRLSLLLPLHLMFADCAWLDWSGNIIALRSITSLTVSGIKTTGGGHFG